MNNIKEKLRKRKRRHQRVRRKVIGSGERPRLSVFRSMKHIYCQIINDVDGKTLASASTQSIDIRSEIKDGGNIRLRKL